MNMQKNQNWNFFDATANAKFEIFFNFFFQFCKKEIILLFPIF